MLKNVQGGFQKACNYPQDERTGYINHIKQINNAIFDFTPISHFSDLKKERASGFLFLSKQTTILKIFG